MSKKTPGKLNPHTQNFRMKPLAVTVRALIAGGVFMGDPQLLYANPALNQLPVAAGNLPSTVTETTVGNTMVINQSSHSAILNWQSYDVGGNAHVNYVDKLANSVTINEIGSNAPSTIMGQITSNGQVILINQNGFSFQNGAVVDTNGLAVSTLQLTPDAMQSLNNPGAAGNNLNGLANGNTSGNVYAAFSANGSPAKGSAGGSDYAGPLSTCSPNPCTIDIGQGAQLTSEGGNPIIIVAPAISNEGTVTSNNGQVIMAAAKDVVYLQEAVNDGVAPNSDVRGLLVEVGTGGNVQNSLQGIISANQGNVTLIGFAVNQEGRVSATTSINENGTVRLLANQGLTLGLVENTYNLMDATSSGSVTLGPKSVTDILPEAQYVNGVETTVVASQAIAPSHLEIVGGAIEMQSGANINVPAGKIDVVATADPANFQNNALANSSSLQIDSGVSINVAGLDSTAAMASNLIAVKLQSSELADSPLQKPLLFGQTVMVDVRADGGKGTPLADISAQEAAMAYTLEQRLGAGGTINLGSEGTLSIQNNAVLNIAGGVTNYAGGVIDTTKLISSTGQIVDIGNASPLGIYTGIYGQSISMTDAKWQVTDIWTANYSISKGIYEPGYQQGYAAGALNIAAPDIIAMQGSVNAQFSSGEFQRAIIAQQALGGILTVDNTSYSALQDIVIGNNAQQLAGIANLDNSGNALVLDSAMLANSGVAKINLNSNGAIILAADANLRLAANGVLKLTAGMIEAAGEIQGTGATVNMGTVNNGLNPTYDGSVTLAAGLDVNLQGGWVNDFVDRAYFVNTAAVNINGGQFNINAQGNVDVANSTINVNGGGWLQANETLAAGSAGGISLVAAGSVNNHNGANLNVTGANFSAYGLQKNGSLTLEANQVSIGGNPSAGNANGLQTLALSDSLFASGGFSTYNITADAYGLSIAPGAVINLQQTNLQMLNGVLNAGSAQSLSALTKLVTLPDYLRSGSTLNLVSNHNYGNNLTGELSVGANSVINASPQSTINLSSDSSIYFDGAIIDHGGAVNMNIVKDNQGFTYSPQQGVWLDSQANIDVSGSYLTHFNDFGLATGSVLNGGNVVINAPFGYVAAQAGSEINVSGTEATVYQAVANGVQPKNYIAETIASNGGSIQIAAAEGLYLDGGMQAHAGGSQGGIGGSLSVALVNGYGVNQATPEIILVQDLTSSAISLGNNNLTAEVLTAGNLFVSPAQAQPGILNGVGIIGANQIMNAGFASLSMQVVANTTTNAAAVGTILLQGDTNVNHGNIDLQLADALTLDAPVISWALTNNGADVTNQIQGTVNLSAPVLTVGSSTMTPWLPASLPAALGGMGELNLNTLGQNGLITLQGEAGTMGFNGVNVHSSQDIRLLGLLDQSYSIYGTTDSFQGEFQTYANLNMVADRIYPTTLSQFTLATSSSSGMISFGTNSASAPAPVLEADATLTVNTGTINQQGNILDPFGVINFQAAKQINFGAESLTSVSGQNEIVPFGITSAGQVWLYPLNDSVAGQAMNLTVGGSQPVGSIPVPEKQLNIQAPSVTAGKGAVIDLAGGGDLLATEFIPGDGGSKNVLLPGNAVGGGTSFAIIQGYGGYAPYDPYLSANSGLTAGETVTLGSGSGLPAGTYTLLPAQYAVLPGAYVITPEPYAVPQGWTLPRMDGAALVSGYFSIAGTSDHWSTTSSGTSAYGFSEFVVQTAGQVLAYSQINLTYGDTFFASQTAGNNSAIPQLAQDAGQLTANVTTALELPTLLTQGVVGAKVDISASNIAVVEPNWDVVSAQANAGATMLTMQTTAGWAVGDMITGPGIAPNTYIQQISGNTVTLSQATTGVIAPGVNLDAYHLQVGNSFLTDSTGVVVLVADNLNNDHIGSLFLGGTRSADSSTGNPMLNVNANNVTVDSNVTLENSSEIILAAENTLTVAGGASLQATGTAGVSANTVLETAGDSAVLRLADAEQISLARSQDPGASGNIQIAQGATLQAGTGSVAGSILVDATGSNNNLQANFQLDSKGSLAIAGNSINLGNTDNQANLTGLSIDNSQLSGFGHISNLFLTGRNYIDAYGAVDTQQITNLTVNTPVLAGMLDNTGNTNNARFNAVNMTLLNSTGASCINASGCSGNGNGALVMDAASLTLASTVGSSGKGSFTISGFNNVTINVSSAYDNGNTHVSNSVTGSGVGVFNIDGNSRINTPSISGLIAANTSIDVSGALTVENQPGGGGTAPLGVGAQLNLTAGNLNVDSSLIYQGGNVNLDSTNSSLQLNDNALIDVSATQQSAGLNPVVRIPAGGISLTAAQDITSMANSQLLLDSTTVGVAAGALSVNAPNGAVSLNGRINANGPDRANGGSLSVDVKSLDTSTFNNASGFDGLNRMAAQAGFSSEFDLRVRQGNLNVDQDVTAHTINFAADSGSIVVGSTLDATGANGGGITLSSDRYIELDNGTHLNAFATTSTGNGGNVTLSAVNQVSADINNQVLTPGGINMETGSTINVTSQGDYTLVNCHALGLCGSLGTVEFLVDRQGVGNVALNGVVGIAPNNTGTASLGYDATQLVPTIVAVQVYDISNPNVSDVVNQLTANDLQTFFVTDANNFMASLPVNSNFTVLPGVEIITTGGADMVINPGNNLDLSAYRYQYGSQTVAGELILRSSGNLDIQQNITDGFGLQKEQTGSLAGTTYFGLQPGGRSWSYDLIAGADLSAADMSRTQVNAVSGNLNLQSTTESVGNQASIGSTSIEMQSVAGFAVGDMLSGTGITAGASIISINYNTNTIVLDQPTTQTIFAGDQLTVATLIRTGAGNIDIQAAGNLNMSSASTIYSAGAQDPNNPYGYTVNQVLYNYRSHVNDYAEYPVNGGNINVKVGGDINVSSAGSSSVMGFFTDWLLRSNSSVANAPTSWGINLALFNDSLGALGGGNISVQAGGNINNLTVAIPTTGKINPLDYANNSTYRKPAYNGNYSEPIISGGGNLALTAGGDIAGGAFYVEQGVANITAGGSLTAGSYYSSLLNTSLDPILALGAAQMNVLAANNLALETILNPLVMATPQAYPGRDSLFFTYQSNSSVTLTALSGNVTLDNNGVAMTTLTDLSAAGQDVTTYPGILTVNALQGNLNINGGMQLFPSAIGNLQLYAYGNIETPANATSDIEVMLSAAVPASLPSVSQPASVSYNSDFQRLQLAQYDNITNYAQIPIHLNDANPVLISTGSGSIESLSPGNNLLFVLAKQATVSSGDNIYNTGFIIQNDTAASNSLITAGQNIEFTTNRDPITGALNGSSQIIQVSGPGQLTVLSGGNIDLGTSNGIVSVGNTGYNTYLPSGGANLTVLAGLGTGSLNATGFADNFMSDSSVNSTFNNLFSTLMQTDLIQQGGAPTSAGLQALVSQALTGATAQLAAQGKTIPFGYKEYFTQYMLDYWNHYTGNLASDGVMSLVSQAASSAQASWAVNTPQGAVANQYAVLLSQYLQTALGNANGNLTLAGFESLMNQAETSVLATMTPQSVLSSLVAEGYSSAQYLGWIANYQTALNQDMQAVLANYQGSQPLALAVAGALSAQAAAGAQVSFDQLNQSYTTELATLVQNYLPNQTITTANAASYLNQLTADQQTILQKQLLPFVMPVYSMDEKQYAEQRAAANLTPDKDQLELDMLATTESLFPGTTLLSLGKSPLTADYHFDQTGGWVTDSGGMNVDTLINDVDVTQLQAMAQQFGNVINLGNGASVDIASVIQTIGSQPNSAYGKSLVSSIYAARPDIQAAIRPVQGNLDMFFSTIQTTGGGDINLLTPNGGIDAGLAINISPKSADQLGVIAFQAGTINALVRDDFQVNESRVITLGGGDVLAGSSEGSIDAGKGVALNGAVQQQVSYNIYGNPVVTLLPPVTSSGIRSAAPANTTIKAGAIVLFAPRGVIDAGEAGIGGGNVFLDATKINNATNIVSSTGISVGTPTTSTPPPAGLSASLSGSSGLAASVNKSFESSTDIGKDTADKHMQTASAALGILSVDLIGFGD